MFKNILVLASVLFSHSAFCEIKICSLADMAKKSILPYECDLSVSTEDVPNYASQQKPGQTIFPNSQVVFMIYVENDKEAVKNLLNKIDAFHGKTYPDGIIGWYEIVNPTQYTDMYFNISTYNPGLISGEP